MNPTSVSEGEVIVHLSRDSDPAYGKFPSDLLRLEIVSCKGSGGFLRVLAENVAEKRLNRDQEKSYMNLVGRDRDPGRRLGSLT